MIKRIIFTLLAFGLIVSTQIFNAPQTHAISAAGFDPGRIIDDAIFYDPAGMGSVSEVQNFLNAHVPACDTWGTGASGYGNLTNAQYAQQVQGWPGPPYVCLNNYYENPTTGDTSFEKGGGAFAGGESAAQIIYDAAQQYKINPKVLLVMLRKESLNLFSDSWPMKSQYKYAMGYACPDSGPNYSASCVSSKAGFYKQVTLAAWQLRYYYDNMGSYNFAPGRVNTIQYSTDPSCGTKNVYIQNYATASLYIYTPYTPNDASLNAYPGTAPCGSYGNRNFWFYWQEWFGSTLTNGNFVRSANDATVYLIGDKVKYPIADMNLIGAAPALGGIGFVSQAYLDSIPTGGLLGRTIQSPDGTIYFYDSNIKLPFTSCALVSDYGGSCGSAAELSQAEIDKFVNGPPITNGMTTTSGKKYYIAGGVKHEVLDDQSLSAAGLSTGYNQLSDTAFNYLSNGSPYVRDNVILQSRQDSGKQLIRVNGQMYTINSTQYTSRAFSTLPVGSLDSSSLAMLPSSTATIDDSFKDEAGNAYVITQDGKTKIPDTQSFPAINVQLPSSFIALLNGSGSLSNPSLLKTTSDGTVYVIVGGEKRPLIAMEDLKSITGQDNPYIGWTSGGSLNAIPTGNIIVGAGRLVMTSTNGTVYMTDGYNKLIPMSSFKPTFDMGVNLQIRVISDAILSKYTIDTNLLSSYVTCGGINYIGMAGSLYQMSISGKTPLTLQPQTCNVLSKTATLPGFLTGPDGTIYQLSNGTLYPITSWAKYLSLSAGGGASIRVTDSVIGILPKGSTL